jgi:hypothetical protein
MTRAILLLSLAARSVYAACDETPHHGLADGPLVIGLYEADMGTGKRACPRSEITLGARASAMIAAERFYGNLGVDTMLSGSWAWKDRAEVFGTLELVHWQFAQNATIKGTAIGFGQLTLGGSLVAYQNQKWVLTPYARLMLPTASEGVRVLGGELGLAAGFHPHKRVELRGFFGGDISGGASAAPSFVRGGANLALGLQYMPWTWLALALDFHFQFGHRAGFDTFALAGGLRFRFWRGIGLELAALGPLAGADEHDFVLLLRLGVTRF